MKVGYQGEEHSYSHRAGGELFPDAVITGFVTFADAFEALMAADVERLVLPIENSTTGSVLPVLDGLVEARPAIVAEHLLQVRHAVIGVPGSDLAAVKRIRSHPEALGQAAGAIRDRGWQAVPSEDTAGAVREVADGADSTEAALGPAWAAEAHGLEILIDGLLDAADNTTRFVVVRSGAPETGEGDDKASLAFTTAHRPGALAAALTALGERGANLTRIESRPTVAAWSYRFFVDLVHDPGREAFARLVDPVPPGVDELIHLGSYRALAGA